MQVTVKLATREGAAHISGILAGFTLLAKRGELTLRVQDARQGSPFAREALLETEIDGRTVVFDLMDGYFYNDPAAVQALFHRADVVFKRSFSARSSRRNCLSIEQHPRLVFALACEAAVVLGFGWVTLWSCAAGECRIRRIMCLDIELRWKETSHGKDSDDHAAC